MGWAWSNCNGLYNIMGLILFALFIFIPLIEIAGFIQIGGLIGLWPTIAIVILTAIAGSMLLRYQGIAVFLRAQAEMSEGKIPIGSAIDGFWLAIAGAFLLTPGFFYRYFWISIIYSPLPPLDRLASFCFFCAHRKCSYIW